MEIPAIPNLILYAIPFFLVSVLIEGYIVFKKNKGIYVLQDSVTSIIMGIGNLAIGILSNIMVVFIISYLYENFRLTSIPFEWWAWILILFGDDISYYWFHRFSHTTRFLWASHVIHHSSEKYNLSTALRQTWTGNFFSFVFFLVLPILGFHPLMIFTQMSVSLLYQYWIHTELIHKMPNWFESVFNTPSHHRVHHGTNPIYLDRNHAGIFIIWDKMFGTFQAELAHEKVVYGLVTNIKTYNPFRVAFLEWYSLLNDVLGSKTSFLNKLHYFSKPPGWKHDGTGLLSDDLRAQWLATKNNTVTLKKRKQ